MQGILKEISTYIRQLQFPSITNESWRVPQEDVDSVPQESGMPLNDVRVAHKDEDVSYDDRRGRDARGISDERTYVQETEARWNNKEKHDDKNTEKHHDKIKGKEIRSSMMKEISDTIIRSSDST